MKIVFTLCSNNYLAQAKILGDSILYHHPDYTYIIGLVDKKSSSIDYSFFRNFQIIPVDEVGIIGFETLWKKYDIVELNTSVKASFFKYLRTQYPDAACIFYFDPDIMLFDKLTELEEELIHNNILLTPHILNPIELDGNFPTEHFFLIYGIYNLGFIGINKKEENNAFLDWWEERTLKLGFNKPNEGLFVDQLWINFAPLFFKQVKILNSLGYNAGPWNLHERKNIIKKADRYFLEDGASLVFYHFSSYSYKLPDQLSKYYARYSFDKRPDLRPLYAQYHRLLLENKAESFTTVESFYTTEREKYFETKAGTQKKTESRIKTFLRLLVPPIVLVGKRKLFR